MLIACLLGFFFAFVGSMPMAGPVGALMFGKSLDGQPRAALHIGWGCAVAEGTYAALAFFGFSALLTQYPMLVPASRAVASLMLFAVGFYFLLRKRLPLGSAGAADASAPARGFLTGLSITGLNVSLLATWGAAATITISAGDLGAQPWLAVPFGLGAMAGMAAWYAIFVATVRRHLHRFELPVLHTVVRGMGCLLVALGISFTWWTSAGMA